MIKVKTYSYVFKILFAVYILALFVAFVVLVAMVARCTDQDLKVRLGMIGLGCVALFLVSGCLVVIPSDMMMKR